VYIVIFDFDFDRETVAYSLEWLCLMLSSS
jgi:hypothetical protein